MHPRFVSEIIGVSGWYLTFLRFHVVISIIAIVLSGFTFYFVRQKKHLFFGKLYSIFSISSVVTGWLAILLVYIVYLETGRSIDLLFYRVFYSAHIGLSCLVALLIGIELQIYKSFKKISQLSFYSYLVLTLCLMVFFVYIEHFTKVIFLLQTASTFIFCYLKCSKYLLRLPSTTTIMFNRAHGFFMILCFSFLVQAILVGATGTYFFYPITLFKMIVGFFGVSAIQIYICLRFFKEQNKSAESLL